MAAQAAGGRRARRQHQRQPVLRAGGAPSGSGCSRTRAADASCALVYVNQVGGQDELVFDGGSMVFDETGALVAVRPAVRRGRARSSTSSCATCSASGARPPRAGAGAAAAGRPRVGRRRRRSRRSLAPAVAPPLDADRGDLRRARARHARLRREERVHRRRHRPVRRDRLVAGDVRRRRRPRARARARGRPADAVHERRSRPSDAADAVRPTSASTLQTIPIEPAFEAALGMLAPVVRGPRRPTSPRRTSRAGCAWPC